MVGKLVLKNEGADGFRHYLDGEPVRCGELLELQGGDGGWIRGRYECDLMSVESRPYLHVRGDKAFAIPTNAILRWSGRKEV